VKKADEHPNGNPAETEQPPSDRWLKISEAGRLRALGADPEFTKNALPVLRIAKKVAEAMRGWLPPRDTPPRPQPPLDGDPNWQLVPPAAPLITEAELAEDIAAANRARSACLLSNELIPTPAGDHGDNRKSRRRRVTHHTAQSTQIDQVFKRMFPDGGIVPGREELADADLLVWFDEEYARAERQLNFRSCHRKPSDSSVLRKAGRKT
jgi:hypothetical protein